MVALGRPGTPAGPPWWRCLRERAARLAAGLLASLLMLAVAAPWLGTLDPLAIDPALAGLPPGSVAVHESLDGVSARHRFLLGTDRLGRDVWSRLLHGARLSLTIGLGAATLALAVGTAWGLMAATVHRGGGLLVRVADALMAIPALVLALALVTLFGGSPGTVIVAIAVPEVPRVARLVRSVTLAARRALHVQAAIAVGCPPVRLLWCHLLPEARGPLAVQLSVVCASAMLAESALSFLGVGLPSELPSWGRMMADGWAQFHDRPLQLLLPAGLLALTVLAVNTLGESLRTSLDPRLEPPGG